MLRNIVILYILLNSGLGKSEEFLGCYKDVPFNNTEGLRILDIGSCVKGCKQNFYRYSLWHSNECICGNFLGEQVNNQTCSSSCVSSCSDIYATGNLVPGPPRNLQVTNVTETSCKITWLPPKSYITISSYIIQVKILHTYSTYSPTTPAWLLTNDTMKTELITLQPATKYNISLGTITPDGNGALAWTVIQTLLDEPDNAPDIPKIIKSSGQTMIIKITPSTNNNGPISAYRVVLLNSDEKENFQPENVMSYDEARRNGVTYYAAADLDPEQIKDPFTIGDGKRYGNFTNVPLDPNINYYVIIGVISTLNGLSKVRYSYGGPNDVIFLNMDVPNSGNDDAGLIIGLSVAIALLSCLLVAGIVMFIILKNRVTNRRQRLSDNQELTLQGPMIEVENNGYIPEEEHAPINHYKSLKQKLRTFTPNQLKIDASNLLGTGKFGRVNSGTLLENNQNIPIAAYSIHDKKMNQETRKTMLQELDLLIKSGKHNNIINLLGTCETSQIVLVALEYHSMNLKDLLLSSRDSLPGKFSSISEQQVLDIAVQICKGMEHLQTLNILHKQLCARSVLISNDFIPKISSYGLAQYYSHNKIPDYTRWTAVEIFKGQNHTIKSDVWSFACLLWELCTLGGTPYGNLSNTNEIPEKIVKGLRLPHLTYFSEEFYQIMLDCWQINLDERPNFHNLVELLLALTENTYVPYLNFNLFSTFQYEQFYPDMELAVRPVF